MMEAGSRIGFSLYRGVCDDSCVPCGSRTLSRSLSAPSSPVGRVPVSGFRTPFSCGSQQHRSDVPWRWPVPRECVLAADDGVPVQSLLDKAFFADTLASLFAIALASRSRNSPFRNGETKSFDEEKRACGLTSPTTFFLFLGALSGSRSPHV